MVLNVSISQLFFHNFYKEMYCLLYMNEIEIVYPVMTSIKYAGFIDALVIFGL